MKKLIFILLLCIISLQSKAQFLEGVEYNPEDLAPIQYKTDLPVGVSTPKQITPIAVFYAVKLDYSFYNGDQWKVYSTYDNHTILATFTNVFIIRSDTYKITSGKPLKKSFNFNAKNGECRLRVSSTPKMVTIYSGNQRIRYYGKFIKP